MDSRDVAKMIGKRHTDLIRDIRRHISVLETDAKLRPSDFFVESSYLGGNGQDRVSFLLTKQGCEFVANKLGVKRDADMSYRDHDGAWRYFPEALKVFQDNALYIQDDDLDCRR